MDRYRLARRPLSVHASGNPFPQLTTENSHTGGDASKGVRTRLLALDEESREEEPYESMRKPHRTESCGDLCRTDRSTVDEFREQSRAIQQELRKPTHLTASVIETRRTPVPTLSSQSILNADELSFAESQSRQTREAVLLEKIANYERQLLEQRAVVARLKEQVTVRNLSVQKLEKELQQCTPEKQSREILAKVKETLGVSNSQKVVHAVKKLERVGRENGAVSKSVREVGRILCPEVEEPTAEDILRAVRQHESELSSLRKRESDYLSFTHFLRCRLNCTRREDLNAALHSLFQQHNELSSFAKQVSLLLTSREDTSIPALLQVVKQRLKPVLTTL